MKKIGLLAFILLAVLPLAKAQQITAEKSFKVNYPINQVGYPSQIVPNKDDKFTFVEFWAADAERKFANHYIQSYNGRFEEQWYRPITKDNSPRLQSVQHVIRLQNALGVIGPQFNSFIKRNDTKLQLFELDGRDKGSLQTISNYTKKAKKGYEEVIAFSPDNKSLFWMGHNPTASNKKRDFYCSVTSDAGNRVWSKRLLLEATQSKYLVRQATIDNRGNAYFYMVYETATNTVKDTVNLPKIVRYDFKENKFSTYSLNFKGMSVPEGMIKVTESGDLVFVGMLSDGGQNGFLNGAKRYGAGLKWNKIAYIQFNIQRELEKKQEYTMDLPESWLKRYKERGADFSKAEMVQYKDKVFWLMEENYTTEHNGKLQHRYYDVAVVAIDMKGGSIAWANYFEKKQIDYFRDEMLSYVMGLSNGMLNFVYLNERGAQGKIMCSSFDIKTGELVHTDLAKNEREDYLFFPRRSAMISENKMMLMGVGSTERDDYKLIEITFE